MTVSTTEKPSRHRVPAAERRDELLEAAMREFAVSGYHGTPVDRIARRVGVAQPYVFSLFGSKRELFLRAVERGYRQVAEAFERVAGEVPQDLPDRPTEVLMRMAGAYYETGASAQHILKLQLQAFAACDDPEIRDRVSAAYAGIIRVVTSASGAEVEKIDDFMRYGLWVTIGAVMGVEDLSAGCSWVSEMKPATWLEQSIAAAQQSSEH